MDNEGFYFEGTNGRAVILFHSFSSKSIDVRTLGRAINKAGYTVFGPTFTGHGTGDYLEPLRVEPKSWFDDGERAVERLLSENYSEIVCMGVSLGGIVSVQTMINNPKVIAAGTMCSPMMVGYDTNTPDQFWETYKDLERDSDVPEEEIEKQRDWIYENVGIVMDYLDQRKTRMQPDYGEIVRPIFIAQGGEDETIDPEQAKAFRDALTQATVDFHWYPEGKHVITLGEYRKPLMEDVIHYLDEIVEWDNKE